MEIQIGRKYRVKKEVWTGIHFFDANRHYVLIKTNETNGSHVGSVYNIKDATMANESTYHFNTVWLEPYEQDSNINTLITDIDQITHGLNVLFEDKEGVTHSAIISLGGDVEEKLSIGDKGESYYWTYVCSNSHIPQHTSAVSLIHNGFDKSNISSYSKKIDIIGDYNFQNLRVDNLSGLVSTGGGTLGVDFATDVGCVGGSTTVIGYSHNGSELCSINNGSNNINNNMSNNKIINFIKQSLLTSDEKLMRKHGLKDSDGEFTDESFKILAIKYAQDNEKYLIDIAKNLEDEEIKNK